MRVGSVKPTLPNDLMQRRCIHRILIRCNWVTSWFYFAFNTFALFRFTIQLFAAFALVYTVVQVYNDLQQRKVDRAVRVAMLFSQIAHLHALPDGKGLKGLKPSVEALAGEGVSMSNINLSGADLRKAQLRGAKLDGADLSGAKLHGANLSDADLSDSDLSGARMYEATITGANLQGANISDTQMFGVVGLEQQQLNRACTTDSRKPRIELRYLTRWSGNRCGHE